MENGGPLKNIVKKVIAKIEEKENEESDLLKIWRKTVGKRASGHTKPAFLKAKRLVVNVGNSSWLYKLTLEKGRLLQELNKNLKGRKKIRELQFRIGEV